MKELLLQRLKAQFITPNHCGLVTEQSTLQEMIELLNTPKGIEHCTLHNLPTYDILLALQDEAPIYWHIEEPNLFLFNPKRAVLVGAFTDATIIIDGTNQAQITMLHGATAHIILRDFATAQVDRASDTDITIRKESKDAFIYDNHNKH